MPQSLTQTSATMPPTRPLRISGTQVTISPLPRSGFRFPRLPRFLRARLPPTLLPPPPVTLLGLMTNPSPLLPQPPRPIPTMGSSPYSATVAEATASHSEAAEAVTTVEAVEDLVSAVVDVEAAAGHGATRPRSNDLWRNALRCARRSSSHRRHRPLPARDGPTDGDDNLI